MTKLVKSFDEGLIPNFAETWGPKTYLTLKFIQILNTQYIINLIKIYLKLHKFIKNLKLNQIKITIK